MVYLIIILQRANDLVRNNIHPTSIISGYRVSLSLSLSSVLSLNPNQFYQCLLWLVTW